jgi:hypothetical protein
MAIIASSTGPALNRALVPENGARVSILLELTSMRKNRPEPGTPKLNAAARLRMLRFLPPGPKPPPE